MEVFSFSAFVRFFCVTLNNSLNQLCLSKHLWGVIAALIRECFKGFGVTRWKPLCCQGEERRERGAEQPPPVLPAWPPF